jgi:hypothetical protein
VDLDGRARALSDKDDLAMTLLTIVQDSMLRMGFSNPASVVGNTDETVGRLFALANQSGRELSRLHQWQILTVEKTFTTVNAEAQTDTPIPADFDRFVDETIFNRSKKRRIVGPLTEEEWQVQKSLTASVITDAFRVRGGIFLIIPAPTADETIAYEYISKYWVDNDADGDGDAVAFAADSETALLDEEMITTDVIWRYRKSAGLNYAEDFRTAQITIAGRIAADGGRRTLDLGRRRLNQKPRIPYTPEGSWF